MATKVGEWASKGQRKLRSATLKQQLSGLSDVTGQEYKKKDKRKATLGNPEKSVGRVNGVKMKGEGESTFL